VQTSFPKHKINVVLFENIHENAKVRFEEEGFHVQLLNKALQGAELHEVLSKAHLIGIRSKTQLPKEVLEAAPQLLAVGCFCIGTNQVDLKSARLRGVPVFNSPFSNTRSVAELTMAEIIALHRKLFQRSSELHRGIWKKSSSGAHEVRGRTLGIIGYGHIGSQISVIAEALGMTVLFYDIIPKLPLGNARFVSSLQSLMEQSDVVTLHVPATKQTENMIGEQELSWMKPGSFLINNARGSVVRIDALAEALRAKRLGGAALDVYPEEPASNQEEFISEVRGLDNVILSPHIGGSTEEAQANIADDVSLKLLKFINIGSTTGAVNVPNVELPRQQFIDSEDDTSRAHRLLHYHKNVPGVLSKVHQIIAEVGANITSSYLQTFEEVGYVVLDVAPTESSLLKERLQTIPETITVRLLW
jgi:D-3-phosphoglycerate dehydrogenase / 2-oxoglutarate reductase